METRKVQKVGGGTVTVSLPRSWADDHDVDAGTEVYLYSHIDGSLVLRRSEKEHSALADVEIEVTDSEPAAATRALTAGYLAGYKRITVSRTDGFAADQRRAIADAVRNLTGVDVVTETDDRIVLEGLLDASEVSIRQSVLQLRYSTMSMYEASMAALAGDLHEIDHIVEREAETDRIFEHVTRHFNRALRDFDEIDKLGVDRHRLYQYYLTARGLEQAADHAVAIASRADEIEDTSANDPVESLRSLGDESKCALEDGVDAVVNGSSIDRAHAALDTRDAVLDRANTTEQILVEQSPADGYCLARILDGVVGVARSGGSIAEVALQMSLGDR